MKRLLLFLSFISILILGFWHKIGNAFYLYWDLRWFDSVAHFLGGLSVGLVFLWLWYVTGIFQKRSRSNSEVLLKTLIFVILVGVAWEIFEYAFNIANPTGGNYTIDTAYDIFFDLLGGVASGLISRVRKYYE